MKIKTITYAKTWQVKQYEPERIEATADLVDGECPITALGELKEFVNGVSTAVQLRKKQAEIETRKRDLEKELDALAELED